MARVLFISLYDRNAYGQRLMSANLKAHGHECQMIFMKRYDTSPTTKAMEVAEDEYPWMGINSEGRVFKYAANSRINQQELGLLRETVARINPQIIGITVNTPLRSQAKLVTGFLKEHFDTPVIWGGYDPTVNPEACLGFCDYACIGEGDQAILDVAACVEKGESFDHVGNLSFIRNGETITNKKVPLEGTLDDLPWRDNEPEGKYFIEDGRIEENHAALNDRDKIIYYTMSARGCPYKCSYCCEATLKDLYSGEKFLRRRSPENLIAELVAVKKRFGIKVIHFDDEIFAMDIKWLEKFAIFYKVKINLPFVAYIYPTRNIEAILTLMKRTGLFYCCLGLESGSERMNKGVFDRVYNREQFLLTGETLKRLDIKFYTDVITYSPYEEEEDLRRTMDALVDLNERCMNSGYDMNVNKLFVLPGTILAKKMALDKTMIGPSSKDAMFNFYSRLFWIAAFQGHVRAIIERIFELGVFRDEPWLLDMGKVKEALAAYSEEELRRLPAEQLMPPTAELREEAYQNFLEDHDAVHFPVLTAAGTH